MRRMEGGGDGGGGGRATGTQERGSKQGEALTSACLTLETERERGTAKTGRGGAQRFRIGRGRRRDRNGKKRDKQQGEKSTGGEKKAMCQRRDIRQVQSDNPPQGGGRAQRVPLTKLRVAVRRLRREATTVPLRLRPIRLMLSPSAGSAAPRCTSRNSIGCWERGRETCLSD